MWSMRDYLSGPVVLQGLRKNASTPRRPDEQALNVLLFFCRASYFLMPVVVIGAIWFSVLRHYYISQPVLTIEMIEQGRHDPHDALLDELSKVRFFGEEGLRQTVTAAEQIMRGEFSLPGEASRKIHLPFDSKDIHQGSVAWQFFHARLIIPRILLAAYRTTGREEFFVMARDIILGWASYERQAVIPKGLLWNDHAVAERVLALADFWELYRHHPSYEVGVANEILVFVARSGRLLADSSHFTGSTNHGVMQNLALWHLSLAFPSLPDTTGYRDLAFERLREQLRFYINDEGVVLEHSAEYHKDGVHFTTMAFRYMSLLGIKIPDEWQQKYQKAKAVYAQLRRPDGSLPMFGDTGNASRPVDPYVARPDTEGQYGSFDEHETWRPIEAHSLYPVAGYSIWWDGLYPWAITKDLSQTVVAWSYFQGQAHKHADEMSVLLWAKGQAWWTNVGYWPYGEAKQGQVEREEAESWNGSNAPHLIDEGASSERHVRLLGHGLVGGLRFIDLERKGPRGFVARRQVMQTKGGIWVIIDHTSGDSRDRMATVWTAAHDIEIKKGHVPESYHLTGRSGTSMLAKFIVGSPGTSLRSLKGSREPFAGWQVVDGVGQPAPAIILEQPANNSWAVVVWSLDDDQSGTKRVIAPPTMRVWEGPEKWDIALPTEAGTIRLFRAAGHVALEGSDARHSVSLTLKKSEGIDEKIAEIREAHAKLSQQYPRFGDHVGYRFKATYLAIGAFVLQEAFFAVYRMITRNYYVLLRGLSVIAWVVLGLFLVMVRERLL